MLSYLTAAAMTVQPLPVDFDLADTVPVGQPVYQTGATTYSTDEREADQWRASNRGIEERRIAFHILNAADLATTLYCLEEVEGCHEANPLYGQSTEAIVMGKVVGAVAYELLLSHFRAKGDRDAVNILQYGSLVILGGVVAWNTTVIF
jgi:hypothetical protein